MNKQESDFAQDVRKGLASIPKKLPSKYLYDAEGDRLFQKIMKMEEYYPTNCEFEIFSMHKEKIMQSFKEEGGSFQLIELGAGDGYKTKILLNYFLDNAVDFEYIPVDISKHILNELQVSLLKEFPNLKVSPLANSYTGSLREIKDKGGGARKVIMFLGSNIGNFQRQNRERFFREVSATLSEKDMMFIGFDLKKNPHTVLAAYNDKKGITKAFNFNILKRINRELEADFDLIKFDHYASYDPIGGEMKSYLFSKVKQTVYIKGIDLKLNFDKDEHIHIEVSKKFDLQEIESLAIAAGFNCKQHFFDCKHYYVDSLWVKKK